MVIVGGGGGWKNPETKEPGVLINGVPYDDDD